MAIDASFEKIEKIIPHPNADKLDIAIVSGYQVVCGKGEFNEGDDVFYVRDDAKLIEWDNLHDSLITKTYIPKFAWQQPFIKYLGNGGRVKTIKLRGEFSSGIIVGAKKVCNGCEIPSGAIDEKDLSEKYGVTHWEVPIDVKSGPMNVLGPLPDGLPKSDEENFQNIKNIIPWGEEVLVTKKLDGTSCTVVCRPDGSYSVCSRRWELLPDDDNIWNRASEDVVRLGLQYAKAKNVVVAFRGEICHRSIQRFSFNHDKEFDNPVFFLYGVMFPYEKDERKRNGMYGTDCHFVPVNEEIFKITGERLRTVPVIGTSLLTQGLIDEYLNKPLDWGEGIVINAKNIHFKCKSLAYLCAVSKK